MVEFYFNTIFGCFLLIEQNQTNKNELKSQERKEWNKITFLPVLDINKRME